MSSSRLRIFLACAPGLESALADETRAWWSDDPVSIVPGGVSLMAPREALWRLVTFVRCAEAVRVRLGRFDADTFDGLKAGLARIPFHAWIPRGAAVDVRATCRKSRLMHTGAVEQRVRAHLEEHRAVVPGADQRVSVRIERDHVTVSVDATAPDHHRHGERAAVGKASLRETLAAAMARALGPTPACALWDPFCGAGTTLLETDAAWRRRPIPARPRPMDTWPTHDAAAFRTWEVAQRSDHVASAPAALIGSDTDARELDAARANAADAGLADACTWWKGDFAGAVDHVPVGAAVVSNTPYGHRAGTGHDLASTFGRFGEVLRARPDLARVVVMVGWHGFVAATGEKWETLATHTNRGKPVATLRLIPR